MEVEAQKGGPKYIDDLLVCFENCSTLSQFQIIFQFAEKGVFSVQGFQSQRLYNKAYTCLGLAQWIRLLVDNVLDISQGDAIPMWSHC